MTVLSYPGGTVTGMTTTPHSRPVPADVQALLDALPEREVQAAAWRLHDHAGHGGTRVQMPNSWCACGTDLGPALLLKAGEQWLHRLLDEVVARRG